MKNAPKNSKVLITGGSGFLGSHVADALTKAGFKVVIYDREPSPYLQDGQEMVVGDLMDFATLSKAIQGCDYIYHFGAIADIDEASRNPVKTASVNVMGTVYLLEAARQQNIKRFVFASTVYVYSNDGGFYRASKQSCERFIETFQEEHGLPFTILRYGTLYGRRSNMNNRIFAMIQTALSTQKIDHPGHGDAIREFIHVQDAARLTVKILDKEYENRHLILTGQEKFRLRDAAGMIAEMMSDKVDVNFRGESDKGHYELTPYAFNPKIGHKLVPQDYVDFGQGLLDCISEQYEILNADKSDDEDRRKKA